MLSPHAAPTPGQQTYQYSLTLSQESKQDEDEFYLLCSGLVVTKHKHDDYNPCQPENYFFSAKFARKVLEPFYVIDEGTEFLGEVSLFNDSVMLHHRSNTKSLQLFALAKDFSGKEILTS